MTELKDILSLHGDDYRSRYSLFPEQAKAFRDIIDCRTAKLGAHTEECDNCGHIRISYNSCRNRHCPKCQTVAKEQWIDKQHQYLLDIGYFHAVFTVPEELHSLFLYNQRTMYNLLFRAASETLMELSKNDKFLGATPGFIAVLHTWGQNLLFHPHIHCIVTGGGLTSSRQWRASRKKFFIPIKVLSKKFRGKFLAHLKQARLTFGANDADLRIPGNFDLFISSLYQKPWITYCKPPFENAAKVVSYLGRYTHRVAISNNRILSLANGMVTFSWRDYKDENKVKNMTISAVEFIRRFMFHILPSDFHRIRHYGILASKGKSARTELCKRLTRTNPLISRKIRSPLEIIQTFFGSTPFLCPSCGIGRLSRASPKS